MIELDENTLGILLDIEGTTSSISFVHDVMFPFVRERLADFLQQRWPSPEMEMVRLQMAADDGARDWDSWLANRSVSPDQGLEACQQRIMELMDSDAKVTGLKSLQGLIWESGFHSGQLRSHVYPDVLPAIEAWRAAGKDVRIYSSGSIAAQKLFFGHVAEFGNCLPLFTGHYDTTIGSKREAASYTRIADEWGISPGQIAFISDLEPELVAASAAGVQAIASVRPGNALLSASAPWPQIQSFDQLTLPLRGSSGN